MDDDDDDEEDKLIRFTFLSYSFVDSRFFSNKKKTKKKKKFDMIFSGQYRRNCHCFNAAKTDKEEEEEEKKRFLVGREVHSLFVGFLLCAQACA